MQGAFTANVLPPGNYNIRTATPNTRSIAAADDETNSATDEDTLPQNETELLEEEEVCDNGNSIPEPPEEQEAEAEPDFLLNNMDSLQLNDEEPAGILFYFLLKLDKS